jgi:hypothetical protein
MDQREFLAAMAEIDRQADEETELLFDGKEDCTDEEGEIIVADLSFEEKMAKLRVLRGSTVKPKTFKKRVTPDDVIRAKALGVRLD